MLQAVCCTLHAVSLREKQLTATKNAFISLKEKFLEIVQAMLGSHCCNQGKGKEMQHGASFIKLDLSHFIVNYPQDIFW